MPLTTALTSFAVLNCVYAKHTSCDVTDDLWPQWEREKSDDGKEPDWIEHEREQFYQHRDKDGDKKLNRVSGRSEGGRANQPRISCC